MPAFARFADGVEVSGETFGVLAKFAPDGVMDVLACDQHSSVLRLLTQFFKNARGAGGSAEEYPEKSTDQHVAEVSRIFARALGKIPAAALFNNLAYMTEGFRDLLGPGTLLIGRLEETNFVKTADGKGQVPQLAVQPEEVADRVDAFKTLVKVDPAHRESWDKSIEWLVDIWHRCRKLGKPLFNETLYTPAGMSKRETGEGLPEALVKIARDFGAYGDFYKTQVPMLWAEDNGATVAISTPEGVRKTTEAMVAVVDRPMLVLSAAVDFPEYAAQYGIVCDLVAGPMCGRAYFKDPFADPKVTDWKALEEALARVAIPRMEQIKEITQAVSRRWWQKYAWLSDDAKKLIKQ
jgi:tagatose-1,6-bisphosphate aldolase